VTAPAQPDLGILLALAYQEFVRELHAAMAAAGFGDLGHSDGYVFRALASQPLTATELASRLAVTKQGTAQIIDDMAARGYVKREPDPRDARARLIDLTPRGRDALACARRFHREYEDRLAATHGEAAVAGVRAVLTAMATAGPDGLDPPLRRLYL
jgi:DNA-binding MarR family transcriptional regulator